MATRHRSFVEELQDDQTPARRGLPQEVKVRIVVLFAQYQGVTAIYDAILKEYGIALDKRTIAGYDPQSPKSRIGPKLKEAFAAARESWLDTVSRIGVAHRGHRLRLLDKVIDKATTAKDFGNAIKGLELAAKEMGGVLEGKSEVKHVGSVAHVHLSVEDAKRELSMRLQEVIEGGKLVALPSPDTTETEPDDNEPSA